MKQIPSVVLPQLGVGTEVIGDAVQHISRSFPLPELQEKVVYIWATAAGGVANLNAWVEISAYDIAADYVMLGVPVVFAATGAQLMAWQAHSAFARIVLQCPLWVLGGSWTVIVVFEGKTL